MVPSPLLLASILLLAPALPSTAQPSVPLQVSTPLGAHLCCPSLVLWTGGLPPFEVKLLHHHPAPTQPSMTTLASLYMYRSIVWTPLDAGASEQDADEDGWEVQVYDATRLAVGRTARFRVAGDEAWVVEAGGVCRQMGKEEQKERKAEATRHAYVAHRDRVLHQIYLGFALLSGSALMSVVIWAGLRWWAARKREQRRVRLVSYEELEEMDLYGTGPLAAEGIGPGLKLGEDDDGEGEGRQGDRLPAYGE